MAAINPPMAFGLRPPLAPYPLNPSPTQSCLLYRNQNLQLTALSSWLVTCSSLLMARGSQLVACAF